MGTDIRPELSKHSKYRLERHRYYELKHFCLQYPLWKKCYWELDGQYSSSLQKVSEEHQRASPVEDCAEKRIFYSQRMEMVERAAAETDPQLGNYILEAVTKGLSYEYVKLKLEIPCCRDTYYELYRSFFWLLDKRRQ